MKGLAWIGILLQHIYFVHGKGQQDCLIDDVYKKQHWSGEEMSFVTYVTENDVVNIKITYKFLEETDYFTTFYFSPSKKYSKRIETKHGEELHKFPLQTMGNKDEWVNFKISSEKGTIRVFYEPNTYEQISINQTSHTFKDLIIRASNISFCKDGKEWEVTAGNHQTIPLGKDMINKSCFFKLFSNYDINPFIKIFNTEIHLASTEYELMIEESQVILKKVKGEIEHIHINISQVVTSVEISSQRGNFTIRVSCKAKDLSFTIAPTEPIPNGENCRNCHDIAYIACLTILGIFFIFTIFIGFTSRLDILPISSKIIKYLLKENQNNNSANEDTNSPNNNRNTTEEENDSPEKIPLRENQHSATVIRQEDDNEEVQHTATEVST